MSIRVVSSELIGQTFGHYRIVGLVGSGGMGVVYRAEDLKLGRQVALKVLTAGGASDPDSIERFKREARTASSLNHTNICTIYGFDEHEGQLYLVMELLDGDPMDKRLSGRPFDMRTVLDIGTQVADALDAAHVGGVLHRDIKPANIFLTRRGTVKVLDFGLAKLAPDFRRGERHLAARNRTAAADHFSSVAGTAVGTIAYMSPEQARGDDVDARTDLFSFGVVLYEMATGRQSFPGTTTAVVFDGILNRDPAPASSLNTAIPVELDRIISKLLEKDRALRYQTAADLGADLKRLRRDLSSRQSIPALASTGSPDATTVVMSPGTSSADGSGSTTSAYAAASVPTGELASHPRPPSSSGSAGNLPRARSTVTVTAPGTKTTWALAAAATVLTIAAIAGGIGAFVASRNSASAPPADQSAATPATPAPAVAAPDPVAAQTQAVPVAPPTVPSPAVPSVGAAVPAAPKTSPAPATTAAAKGGPGNTRPADRRATGAAAPVKTHPGAPAPVISREVEATERLDVARAKVANHLNDQALVDLRQIVADYPGTRASIEAAFLAGEVLEKNGKTDDAMAAYVEVESRFKGDPRAADAKLRRAGLLGRSRQPRAESRSRELLNEVVRDFPGTPQANLALQTKLKIETDRRDLKEIDPVLKVEVPAAMVTLRTLIEQFPNSQQAIPALNRLSMMLSNMNRHAEAADALEQLGARFPGNPMDVWFRLGEIYGRRLDNPAKAKEAYTKVPQDSPSYKEAQKRLNRK